MPMPLDQLSPAQVSPSNLKASIAWQFWGMRCLQLATLLIVAYAGWQLRLYAWDWADRNDLHYDQDLNNAITWGTHATEAGGIGNLYQQLAIERGNLPPGTPLPKHDGSVTLDYTPGRLWIMQHWSQWIRSQEPRLTTWTALRTARRGETDPRRTRLTYPLLAINFVAEAITALGLFLLVLRRTDSPWRAIAAAAGVWLNLALILDAHAWPQSEAWSLPFFVVAIVLCDRQYWFSAGFILMVGSAFKGQILLIVPAILIWPIYRRHFISAATCLAGAVFGAGMVAAPFIFDRTLPIVFVFGTVLAVATLLAIRYRDRRHIRLWTIALLTDFGVAALACHPLFHSSHAWFDVGYGTSAQIMRTLGGPYAANVGCILENIYNLSTETTVLSRGDHPWLTGDITLYQFLFATYVIGILFSGFVLARHDRTRNPSFLAALACPWLIAFALMPQMHERYLLWGAVISAAAIGLGLHYLILHLALTAFASLMVLSTLIRKNPHAYPEFLRFINRSFPDMAWGVVCLVAVYLYVSAKPKQLIDVNRRP